MSLKGGKYTGLPTNKAVRDVGGSVIDNVYSGNVTKQGRMRKV